LALVLNILIKDHHIEFDKKTSNSEEFFNFYGFQKKVNKKLFKILYFLDGWQPNLPSNRVV